MSWLKKAVNDAIGQDWRISVERINSELLEHPESLTQDVVEEIALLHTRAIEVMKTRAENAPKLPQGVK